MVYQLKITSTANIFAICCLLVIYRQSDIVPLRVLNCAVTLSPVHVGLRAPGYWKPVWNPHKLDLLKECFPELDGLNLFYDFFSNGWCSYSVSLVYLVPCTGGPGLMSLGAVSAKRVTIQMSILTVEVWHYTAYTVLTKRSKWDRLNCKTHWTFLCLWRSNEKT